MKFLLIALSLLLTPLATAVSAQGKLQEIQIPDPVRDFTFGAPKVVFNARMKERGITLQESVKIHDEELDEDVAERHVFHSHMGITTVFTPIASREMPQPAYEVVFTAPFPSSVADLEAVLQNALNTFGLRHAPSCPGKYGNVYFFDENWIPASGPCGLRLAYAGGLNDASITRAMLDGDIPRYSLSVNLFPTVWKKPNDQTLSVVFQDNLQRAQYEARVRGNF